jgi:nitroreductase
MNVMEAIQTRRAVRAYSPRTVDEATIQTLLRAAVQAPNALNEQLWIFSVVQNLRQLERWSSRAKSILLDQAASDPKTHHYNPRLTDERFNIFYDAGTLIVIGSKERGTYTDADCWLAAENLMLAACEAGLGSCPIGFAIPWLNTSEAKKELGFPASAVAVSPIILGYPKSVVPVVARAEPQVLSWIR